MKRVLDCLKEGYEDAYVTSLSFFSQFLLQPLIVMIALWYSALKIKLEPFEVAHVEATRLKV